MSNAFRLNREQVARIFGGDQRVVTALTELQDMAYQDSGSVSITGGKVVANIENNQGTIMRSATPLQNVSGSALGTLNNCPIAGNPSAFFKIIDSNGDVYVVPAWKL